MATNIKDLHLAMMKRLRTILPKKVKLVYIDNYTASVPCTLAKENIDNINYDKYVGQNRIFINILIEDLRLNNAPMKDFLYIVMDRKEYQVESVIRNGVYDNSIQLVCKLFKNENI